MPKKSHSIARLTAHSAERLRHRSVRKAPAYRQRKGYDQALVTLTDAVTKQRRDYWLGTFTRPGSRERYHQLLAQWEAGGRRLPEPTPIASGTITGNAANTAGPTVAEVLINYWRWVQSVYGRAEVGHISQTIRLTRRLFGTAPAEAFGPKRLRMVREAMVLGDPDAEPPREPWSRPYINKQINRLCAIFKWAAGHEMVPVTVYQQLKAVESLKRGRTDAREPEPVRPVPDAMVDAIRPFVSRQVWALIELQRLTGARGGELFGLRRDDLDITQDIWSYSPRDHKTAHHGHRRTIYFGPKAQDVLQPFLVDRPGDAYLFSATEAEFEHRQRKAAARVTPMSCGNRSNPTREQLPPWPEHQRYNKDSYNRAIARGCDHAFPPPDHLARRRLPARGRKWQATRWESPAEWRNRLGPQRWAELKRWQREHRWHPHQLRHTAATRIRREFGLEAAQIALGHSSALVTDAIYAERDTARVIEIMRTAG